MHEVQVLVAMFCQTKPGEFTNERCLRCLMVKIPSVDQKKSPILLFGHLARHHLRLHPTYENIPKNGNSIHVKQIY